MTSWPLPAASHVKCLPPPLVWEQVGCPARRGVPWRRAHGRPMRGVRCTMLLAAWEHHCRDRQRDRRDTFAAHANGKARAGGFPSPTRAMPHFPHTDPSPLPPSPLHPHALSPNPLLRARLLSPKNNIPTTMFKSAVPFRRRHAKPPRTPHAPRTGRPREHTPGAGRTSPLLSRLFHRPTEEAGGAR